MRKICKILVALALVVLCVVLMPTEAQAASESDLTFTLNADGVSYSVTDCKTSASGSLTIPSTYKGKPVTGIGYAALENCSSLISVTIPSSITYIGSGAFAGCSALYTVYISDMEAWCNISFGETKTYISILPPPSGAFEAVVFMEANPLSYAQQVYVNGDLVTELVIPQGVTTINAYAFYGINCVEAIVIPESVSVIGKSAFGACGSTNVIYCGTSEQWKEIEIDFSKHATLFAPAANSLTEPQYHSWKSSSCITLPICAYCGVTGTEYQHTWIDATCISAKFCFTCGKVEGVALGHNWQISCNEPTICLRCGETTGTAPGHSWVDATCTSPKTCTVCNKTEGTALGHFWIAATCTTPKTCTICGTTQGTVQHYWNAATCTTPKTCAACNVAEGDALGHLWQNATCLAPKTCATCGLTEGGLGGHIYDNNGDAFCNVCNEQRTLEDATLKFYSTPSLSFQDYIGMQILIRDADVTKYDKVYAIAVQETPDGSVETVLQGTPYYGVYQMFSQQTVSWSMTEQVTMTLYGEISGVIYKGQSISTSVAESAMSKLATYKAQNNLKACRALVDMLNYGAAVQIQFDHNAENLPNADLGDFASLGTTDIPAFNGVNTISGTAKVPALNHNISLQAKAELQLLFGVDISAYTPKATVNGKEADVEIDTETYASYGGWTLIKVPVGAVNMRDTFTIALYDANGNAVTQIYEVSVEGYATARQGSTYSEVDIALMRYGDSVAAL